jgi:hypothetical protein
VSKPRRLSRAVAMALHGNAAPSRRRMIAPDRSRSPDRPAARPSRRPFVDTSSLPLQSVVLFSSALNRPSASGTYSAEVGLPLLKIAEVTPCCGKSPPRAPASCSRRDHQGHVTTCMSGRKLIVRLTSKRLRLSWWRIGTTFLNFHQIETRLKSDNLTKIRY